MAVGANLKYGTFAVLWREIVKVLIGDDLHSEMPMHVRLCKKNGVPANDTAADNPMGVGDICLDYANDDVYVCTAWTSDASATTWTKISS